MFKPCSCGYAVPISIQSAVSTRIENAFEFTVFAQPLELTHVSRHLGDVGHSAPNGGSMALLSDGTVVVPGNYTNTSYKPTPDANGSYLNGTWSSIADRSVRASLSNVDRPNRRPADEPRRQGSKFHHDHEHEHG